MDKDVIQQDAIAGTWRRYQVHMADMQQQLSHSEGTHDVWQLMNYTREFFTVNGADLPCRNRALDALRF